MKKIICLVMSLVLLSLILLAGCAPKEEEVQLVGAYGEDRALTAEDRAVFDKAMEGLMGVSYEPLLVSTQVVAGLNYRFTAEATVVAPDAETTKVFIYIFQPLGDEPPELVEIVDE